MALSSSLVQISSRSSRFSLLRGVNGLPFGATRSRAFQINPSARSLSTRILSPLSSQATRSSLYLGAQSQRWSSSFPPVPTPTPSAESIPPISSDSTPSLSSLPTDSHVASTIPSLSTPSVPLSDGSIADLITSPLATGNHIGDFASLGLGGWGPVGIVQNLLEQIHLTTGLPWWATIATLATVVRIASFPLHVRVTANNSRMASITPQMKEITAAMAKAKETHDQTELMKNAMKMRQMYADANASPLTGLLGFVQVPVAFAMFFGIKGVCNSGLESLKTGGLSWFTDLSIADPTYVLPALSTAAFVVMLRASSAEVPKTAETKHMTNGFTILSLIGFPFLTQLPAGVMIYFLSNGLLQGLQSFVLRIPMIRDRLGISPPTVNGDIVSAPTMIETLQAGYNKLVGFNKDKFEQIKRDAVKNAQSDLERRTQAEAAKRRTKPTPKQLVKPKLQSKTKA